MLPGSFCYLQQCSTCGIKHQILKRNIGFRWHHIGTPTILMPLYASLTRSYKLVRYMFQNACRATRHTGTNNPRINRGGPTWPSSKKMNWNWMHFNSTQSSFVFHPLRGPFVFFWHPDVPTFRHPGCEKNPPAAVEDANWRRPWTSKGRWVVIWDEKCLGAATGEPTTNMAGIHEKVPRMAQEEDGIFWCSMIFKNCKGEDQINMNHRVQILACQVAQWFCRCVSSF